MQNFEMERIAVLERHQRLFLAVNVCTHHSCWLSWQWQASSHVKYTHKKSKMPKNLVLSELTIVDSHGVVRARLGGNLPDANKKSHAGAALRACSFMTRQVRNEVGTSPSNPEATWG